MKMKQPETEDLSRFIVRTHAIDWIPKIDESSFATYHNMQRKENRQNATIHGKR